MLLNSNIKFILKNKSITNNQDLLLKAKNTLLLY